MRGLLLPPIVVVLVAAGGFAICRAMNVDPVQRAMIAAGVIMLVASVLAVVPLVLVRGASQYAVSQAGLVGTMLHLMVSIGSAMVVYLKLQAGSAFLWWLCGMYFPSLVAVVVVTVMAVKAAPPDKSPAAGPPADSKN